MVVAVVVADAVVLEDAVAPEVPGDVVVVAVDEVDGMAVKRKRAATKSEL